MTTNTLIITKTGLKSINFGHGKSVQSNGYNSGGPHYVSPQAPFFNSQEPRDSNTLFADDFSRGTWYTCDGDHTYLTHPTCDDGAQWQGGNIFGLGGNQGPSPNPPCYGPPNSAALQNGNFGPSTWTATHQNRASQGGSTMATHDLVNGGASETEIWLRWYQRFSSGYLFGAEKCYTINRFDSDGIFFGDCHLNVGGAGGDTGGHFQWQPQIFDSNVSSNYRAHGDLHWNCFQVHIKLNTPGSTPGTDGILELYADDCGTSGLSHPSTPTLRAQRLNYQFPRINASDKIGNLWKENWANPASSGSSDLAYIYCSRNLSGLIGSAGPIPFVDLWP